jgi:hypothetical protein
LPDDIPSVIRLEHAIDFQLLSFATLEPALLSLHCWHLLSNHPFEKKIVKRKSAFARKIVQNFFLCRADRAARSTCDRARFSARVSDTSRAALLLCIAPRRVRGDFTTDGVRHLRPFAESS